MRDISLWPSALATGALRPRRSRTVGSSRTARKSSIFEIDWLPIDFPWPSTEPPRSMARKSARQASSNFCRDVFSITLASVTPPLAAPKVSSPAIRFSGAIE